MDSSALTEVLRFLKILVVTSCRCVARLCPRKALSRCRPSGPEACDRQEWPECGLICFDAARSQVPSLAMAWHAPVPESPEVIEHSKARSACSRSRRSFQDRQVWSGLDHSGAPMFHKTSTEKRSCCGFARLCWAFQDLRNGSVLR